MLQFTDHRTIASGKRRAGDERAAWPAAWPAYVIDDTPEHS
jgi:hypothetical protein